MDLNTEFEKVIEKLKKHERPLTKFTDEEFQQLNAIWTTLLEERKYEELPKLYCLLDNTQNFSNVFTQNIYQTFKLVQDSELIIFNLSAASKHIISFHHKKGERVPFELIEVLKGLLSHKDPEVLEWALRTIEQLGSQAIFLKDDIINSKPGILSLFDKHRKASKQIIEMLEKRWSPKK